MSLTKEQLALLKRDLEEIDDEAERNKAQCYELVFGGKR